MFDGTPVPQAASYRPAGCRYGPGIEWLCVRTQPQKELLADGCLRRLGLCTWLPQHFDRERLRPLFPGYLFAQDDLDTGPWRAIYRQPGVVTVLGTHHERPAVVPAAALAVLWASCQANGCLYPGAEMPRAPLPTIAPGAPVTVTAGAFAELQGICLRSSADRVKILLTVMGHAVPVTMARAAVE